MGSGLSTALGISSWTSLLRRVAYSCLPPDRADSVCNLLNVSGQQYEAADELARLLGRPTLEAQVIAIIREDQDRVLDSTPYWRYTGMLRALGSAGIITTNWDKLLPRITGYEQLVWPNDSTTLAAFLSKNRPFVLYLHGNIDNPPLVITRDDCSRQAETFQQTAFRLETMLAANTLNVVGSSYPDAHLNQLYAAASRMAGHNSRLRVTLFTADGARRFRSDHPDLAKGTVLVNYREYADLPDALRQLAASCDTSERLVGIQHLSASDAAGLYDIVSVQPYSFVSTFNLRKEVIDSRRADLCDASAMLLLDDTAFRDRVTAGLLATLLSTTGDIWRHSPPVLDALETRSRTMLGSDPNCIGIVEPLVFALARHGRRERHHTYITTVVHDSDWRVADIARIGEYYEDRYTQVAAMKRHLADRQQDGLLGANDITRLLNLLAVVDDRNALEEVKQLTNSAIDVLYRAGEETLAKRAGEDRDRILRERRATPLVFENLPT